MDKSQVANISKSAKKVKPSWSKRVPDKEVVSKLGSTSSMLSSDSSVLSEKLMDQTKRRVMKMDEKFNKASDMTAQDTLEDEVEERHRRDQEIALEQQKVLLAQGDLAPIKGQERFGYKGASDDTLVESEDEDEESKRFASSGAAIKNRAALEQNDPLLTAPAPGSDTSREALAEQLLKMMKSEFKIMEGGRDPNTLELFYDFKDVPLMSAENFVCFLKRLSKFLGPLGVTMMIGCNDSAVGAYIKQSETKEQVSGPETTKSPSQPLDEERPTTSARAAETLSKPAAPKPETTTGTQQLTKKRPVSPHNPLEIKDGRQGQGVQIIEPTARESNPAIDYYLGILDDGIVLRNLHGGSGFRISKNIRGLTDDEWYEYYASRPVPNNLYSAITPLLKKVKKWNHYNNIYNLRESTNSINYG